MNKQTKKFTLATISALSLLGAGIITANHVSASERVVYGQTSSGSSVNIANGLYTSNGHRIIGVKGSYLTPDKQAIINKINNIRKEAYNEGLVDRYVPVVWSSNFEKATLIRAAEVSISYNHNKLTGEDPWGYYVWNTSNYPTGENIVLSAGSDSFNYAIDKFYAEKQNYINKSGDYGHYENLIDPENTSTAMSSFIKPGNGGGGVAQWLGTGSSSDSLVGTYGDSIVYTEAHSSFIDSIGLKQNLSVKPSSSLAIDLLGKFKNSREVIIPTNRDWSSSDTSVATIDRDGNITARKSGTTTITVTSDGKTYSTTVTVSANASDQTSNSRVDTNPQTWTNDPNEYLARVRQSFAGDSGNSGSSSWIRSGSRWWYKHADGSYTTNDWEKINGVWYRFDNSGWMQTGWVKDGSWYYLDGSGAMKTGWLKDNGSWYYLQDSGAMKTGWMKVSSKWYYAYSSGELAINTTTPDGYRVNYNGEWV